MTSTRVIVVDLPRMLKEIIERIVGAERDIEVVEFFAGDVDAAIRKSGANALVTGAPSDPESIASLLRVHPQLRVIAVESSGETGWLWELRPHREPLGQLSKQRLVQALRGTPSPSGIVTTPRVSPPSDS